MNRPRNILITLTMVGAYISSAAVLLLTEKDRVMVILLAFFPGKEQVIDAALTIISVLLGGGGAAATYQGRMRVGDVYSPPGLPGPSHKDFFPNKQP